MSPNAVLAKFRSTIEPYLLAAELVGACVLVRLLLDDYFLRKFFSTVFFYPAIILTAYWCGAVPALMAVVLSCLSIRYFFMRPPGQFLGIISPWDPLRLMLFAGSNLLVIGLISQLQASKKRIARMVREAEASQARLQQEVAERTAAEKRLRDEQAFLLRLIDHQESEKQSLCNDFHDGLIQNVVGSKMLLEARFAELPDRDPIREVIHHLGKGIEDGRRVIRGIRPSVLDEPGLEGMLHELVEHFSALGFAVDAQCCPEGGFSALSDGIRTAIFRICQESLTNSFKHSGCQEATVRIWWEDDFLAIDISDEGQWVNGDASGRQNGFGLKGMEARTRLLGGTFALDHRQPGTQIRVRLPLPAGASGTHG